MESEVKKVSDKFADINKNAGGCIKHRPVKGKGRYALRCKSTRQFYVTQTSEGCRKSLDPNQAQLFTANYLSVGCMWEWFHAFEEVEESEVKRLGKAYKPQETAVQAQTATNSRVGSYRCLTCKHENIFTPFVFQKWNVKLESRCSACGQRHFILQGVATKKGK